VIRAVSRNAPDSHAGTRNARELDGARETLVSLRIIVLEADLELDGLQEVSLLGLVRVLEQLLHVRAHSGDCDLRHDDGSLPEITECIFGMDLRVLAE